MRLCPPFGDRIEMRRKGLRGRAQPLFCYKRMGFKGSRFLGFK
jgi:hypothetical protein